MKTTPFTDVHIALGAKMHEFAGYNMPIEYTGIIDEHMTVVNGVGVFDVSHMGEFWVEKYMLVVNAANIEKDWNWCVSHNTVGAELENASDNIAQLAIQGPKALEVLQRLTPVDLSAIPYYAFTTGFEYGLYRCRWLRTLFLSE